MPLKVVHVVENVTGKFLINSGGTEMIEKISIFVRMF